MATVTSLGRGRQSNGRGRQGKVMVDADHASQSASNNGARDRDGQTSTAPAWTPAHATGKTGGVSRALSFSDLISTLTDEPRLIASCWHPEPNLSVISLNAGDVRVLVGEAAYQLSSGEIVRL